MDNASSRSQVGQLMAATRQGNADARQSLMAIYRPYLRLLAEQRLPRLVAKRADGSDIVQQTLLDAVRGFEEFRGESEPELTTWLLKLLERNLQQSLRRHLAGKRDVRRELENFSGDSSAELVWYTLAAGNSAPASQVFRGEAAIHLAQGLEQLPEPQRQAVKLRYLAQMPLEEIAREMDKTQSSVAGLIARGVEALRRLLPKELGEP